MSKAEFKELNRCRISDSTEIVLSKVTKDGEISGYNINRFVDTEGFKGFTKGILVPPDMLTDFLKMFPKDNLTMAAEA